MQPEQAGALQESAFPVTLRRVIYDASLDELQQRVWDGQRIDLNEAQRLYRLPLEDLGALADRRRQLAKENAHDGRGNDIVTYMVDRNINYTNICNVYCKFCNFWRSEKAKDAYVISHEEIDQKIQETVDLGGTQILMQGGHHPKLTKQWYLDLLSHIRDRFPTVNIHAFSPSEFVAFSEFFDEPVETVIRDFAKAGLGSIPGGGGEILVDEVRNRVSPLKAMTDDWLGVMDTAHSLGLATTVTMMFGHVETLDHRLEHLDRTRQQQDKSIARLEAGNIPEMPTDRPGGKFSAYICWNFQAEGHKAESAHSRRQRIPAHAGPVPHLPGQHREHPKFMGDAGIGHRTGRAEIRRQRSRQHHDRGERRIPGRHHLPHGRGGHETPHHRTRLRTSPAGQLVQSPQLNVAAT